ncbi:hypothetical protein [Priestia megaterium]
MELNAEAILTELNEQNELFNSSRNEVHSLYEQQSDYIQNLINQFKPIFDWYKGKSIRFTHPSLKVNSTAGPILGADENLNYAIVYNIGEEKLEKVTLYNENRESYFIYNLVRDGHFQNAVAGISYLTIMLEKYRKDLDKLALKLRNEIEEEA